MQVTALREGAARGGGAEPQAAAGAGRPDVRAAAAALPAAPAVLESRERVEIRKRAETGSSARITAGERHFLSTPSGTAASGRIKKGKAAVGGRKELLASPGAPGHTETPQHSQSHPVEPLLEADGACTPATRGAVQWGE